MNYSFFCKLNILVCDDFEKVFGCGSSLNWAKKCDLGIWEHLIFIIKTLFWPAILIIIFPFKLQPTTSQNPPAPNEHATSIATT
jgi:hypothetical protein